MHSVTLDVASGILLLSSFFYFYLILKKIPRSSLKSSTSVLSISDVANSIITALMILVYQFYYKHENYSNQVIAKGNQSIEFDDLFVKNSLYLRQDTVNSNSSENCDNQSVFLQYAMFFVPFTNAFVSLTCFSFSFYATASKVNRKCCRFIENQNEVNEDPKVSKKGVCAKKYTGLAVISQWLLPVIIGAIFQSGRYEKIHFTEKSSDELICSLGANFPFESWMNELSFTPFDPIKSLSASENYVGDEENLAWPNPNSSKVQDVLSKIYQVIQEAQNGSEFSKEKEHYNITQILDITNIRDIENSSAIASDDFVDDNYIEWQSRLFERVLKRSFEKGDVHSLSFNRKYKLYDTYLLESINLEENKTFILNKMDDLQSVKNRCVISTKFLKFNLFILLCMIYFIPILVSSVLLVISYYKCRETAAKLMDKNEPEKVQVEPIKNKDQSEPNAETSSSKGWFPPETKSDESANGEENHVKCTELEKIICELYCKTERTQNFLSIFRMNIVAAVLLWTPFFVYILSKVFFCSNVPSWLTETAFMATVIFVVFRNAVYVNIFKMESADPKKSNIVHPNP